MRYFHLPPDFVARPQLLLNAFTANGLDSEMESTAITVRLADQEVRVTLLTSRILGNATLEDSKGKGRPDPSEQAMAAVGPSVDEIANQVPQIGNGRRLILCGQFSCSFGLAFSSAGRET